MTDDSKALYDRIRTEVGGIKLVDAHEHLPSERMWLSRQLDRTSATGSVQLSPEPDFSSLLGYVYGDLVSAGMPKDAILPGMDWEDKWNGMMPFWRYVRNTGAGYLCRRVLSTFFGESDLNTSTIPVIHEKLAEIKKPGAYDRLLKKRFGIEVCANVVDPVTEASASELFAPLLYTANFSAIQTRAEIHRVAETANQDIYSLKTYLNALDSIIETGVARGIVGIKWHKLAYLRDIHYPPTHESAAESCFDRILAMPAAGGTASNTAVGFDEMRPFQDFIQHHLVRRAIAHDLSIQIHTGTLGGSHGAQISHTNPTHLVNLFLQYPQARFDLLHAGYPYMRELTAIVKLFPNVFINMAWFDILSPKAVKQYLREWMTSVPTNKIFAFGGDQKNILHSCASADWIRDTVSGILTAEIIDGVLSEEEALETAADLLRTNAWRYFKLEHRRVKN